MENPGLVTETLTETITDSAVATQLPEVIASAPTEALAGGDLSLPLLTIAGAASVYFIASVWRVLSKAGQPGWAALVPFYNFVALSRAAGKTGLFAVLCFVPFINIAATAMLCHGLSKNFGRGRLFGVGLFLMSPIFLGILAFGKSEYQAQKAAPPSSALPGGSPTATPPRIAA